jgi:hypothetical protein
MSPFENMNTISEDDNESDNLIILFDQGSSEDEFLTTSYSHEGWGDDTLSDIDSYL